MSNKKRIVMTLIVITILLLSLFSILLLVNKGNELTKEEEFLRGARVFIKKNPIYESKYYEGGYPTDNRGVCTDIIWFSFRYVGVDFKSLIDEDIRNNLYAYTNIKEPNPNIDFRRVKNIKVFLDRKAISLTTSLNEREEWKPGDIVIFRDNEHIAIVSDKHNDKGYPYILHLSTRGAREEDRITKDKITSHYRWKFK